MIVALTLVPAAVAADVVATAPDDVRVEDLGALYDAYFQPVRGASLTGDRRDSNIGSTCWIEVTVPMRLPAVVAP